MHEDKYLITRERKLDLTPCYWNGISQTSPKTHKIYGINIKAIWQYFNKGSLIQFFRKKEWENAGSQVANKMYNNKKFISDLEIKLNQAEKLINNFFDKNKRLNYKEFTFNESVKTAYVIKDIWLNYDNINVPSWYIGGDEFKERVEKSLKIPQDDFLFLTTPPVKTAVSRLEYELLKNIKLVKDGKRDIEKVAEKLSEDYGWIPFGYDGLEYWDKSYFINKLKKEVKNYSKKVDEKINAAEKTNKENLKKRNKIIKKYKLNKEQLDKIDKINLLAVWTDERKKLEFKLHYYYSRILLELEKRYNIPYINLKYLFTEELREIEINRENVLRKTNWRLKNPFIAEFKNGKGEIILEKRINKILKELENQTMQSEIKGMVASKGESSKYQGIVKVLLSPKEGNRVKKGDFLVATMTTPDYIIPMNKAAGFITDEGGITCHAAIVAREMNKPCIIGTKIATKILHDGQIVEVDANKGVIKIIK